jgi:hypothetical protein
MRRRTRHLPLIALTAAAAIGFLVAWVLWPRTAITRENYERIHVGMTRAEVEAILGGPARDETGGWWPRVRGRWEDDGGRPPEADEALRSDIWESDGLNIWVQSDGDGRVRRKAFSPVSLYLGSPLTVLRSRLGL